MATTTIWLIVMITCVFNNCFECNKREICSQKGVLVVEFDDEVEANDIDGNNNNVVNGDENSCDLVLNNRFWRSTSF